MKKLDILKGFNLQKLRKELKVIRFKAVEVRPEVMLGVGAGLVAVGTVLACLRTEKAKDVIGQTKDSLEQLEDKKHSACNQKHLMPKKEEYLGLYAHTAYALAKVYGLPALLWFGGMGCILGSHGELRSRNAKLLANSVGLKKLMDEYRRRVAEKIGEEAERDLFLGADEETVETVERDEKTGEEKIVKRKGKAFRSQPGSMYARNFTKNTSNEFDIRSYSDWFIDAKIAELNRQLRMEPFLTLNDVYDALGLKGEHGRCSDGMTVGWCANPKIDRGDREIKVERLEGWEMAYDNVKEKEIWRPCLRLDFNCYPLEGLI